MTLGEEKGLIVFVFSPLSAADFQRPLNPNTAQQTVIFVADVMISCCHVYTQEHAQDLRPAYGTAVNTPMTTKQTALAFPFRHAAHERWVSHRRIPPIKVGLISLGFEGKLNYNGS